jgi:uncharacterized peroxidase-related enzyme
MSRISMIQPEQATGATADVFAKVKKAAGRVPNAYATVGTHSPAALEALLSADRVLTTGSLDRKDQEAIKLAVSELAGCDYCVAAHTLVAKMVGLPAEATRQIRAGQPTGDAKRDALVRFVRHLVQSSGTISDAEFQSIVEAGYTERQIVEIGLAISIITFTNVLNRINDTDVDFPAV